MPDQSRGRYIAIGLLIAVLHYIVSRQVEVLSIRPNLLLMLACMAALVLPFRQATTVAFVAGLVADLFTTVPFGTSAFSFLAAASVAGLIARSARPTPVVRAVITYVASFIGVLAYVLVSNLAGQNSGSAGHVIWVASIISLINAIIAPLLLMITPQTFSRRRRSDPSVNW